ncbi:MAG: hypothetical protein ACR2GR_04300 [Rhodothermales bacterium]
MAPLGELPGDASQNRASPRSTALPPLGLAPDVLLFAVSGSGLALATFEALTLPHPSL